MLLLSQSCDAKTRTDRDEGPHSLHHRTPFAQRVCVGTDRMVLRPRTFLFGRQVWRSEGVPVSDRLRPGSSVVSVLFWRGLMDDDAPGHLVCRNCDQRMAIAAGPRHEIERCETLVLVLV